MLVTRAAPAGPAAESDYDNDPNENRRSPMTDDAVHDSPATAIHHPRRTGSERPSTDAVRRSCAWRAPNIVKERLRATWFTDETRLLAAVLAGYAALPMTIAPLPTCLPPAPGDVWRRKTNRMASIASTTGH